MKFLIDEDLSYKLAPFLKELGHKASHIREIQISLEDFQILKLAVLQDSIVITMDRDFGELVFKKSKSHSGVIYMRLEDQRVENTKRALIWLLKLYSNKFKERLFTVITEKEGKFKIRFKVGI